MDMTLSPEESEFILSRRKRKSELEQKLKLELEAREKAQAQFDELGVTLTQLSKNQSEIMQQQSVLSKQFIDICKQMKIIKFKMGSLCEHTQPINQDGFCMDFYSYMKWSMVCPLCKNTILIGVNTDSTNRRVAVDIRTRRVFRTLGEKEII